MTISVQNEDMNSKAHKIFTLSKKSVFVFVLLLASQCMKNINYSFFLAQGMIHHKFMNFTKEYTQRCWGVGIYLYWPNVCRYNRLIPTQKELL